MHRFLRPGDHIIKEYVEVESGKRNNRPQLQEAIKQVSQSGVQLLIAKLDRLSRNASFIFILRDSKVSFVAADMPDANNLTVGIMAVLADHERQLISDRTSAALQVKKKELAAHGKKLGTPANLKESARLQGIEVRKKNAYDDPNNRRAGGYAVSLHSQGKSYSEIARQLNIHGFVIPVGEKNLPIVRLRG